MISKFTSLGDKRKKGQGMSANGSTEQLGRGVGRIAGTVLGAKYGGAKGAQLGGEAGERLGGQIGKGIDSRNQNKGPRPGGGF